MNKAQRVALQPAYVLHGKPYRDSSMIVEVFTSGYGRLSLVARGAKGPKSRFYGLLQPFRPLLISWIARGELGTLTAAELNGAAPWHQGRNSINALYLNELLLRLVHRDDPHPVLFSRYADSLRSLAPDLPVVTDQEPAKPAPEWAIRMFEKCLLEEIGYGLVLDHDVVSGETILADELYNYTMNKGPARLADPHRVSTDGLAMHGRTLLVLSGKAEMDEVVLKEAKQLMRKVLAEHLGGKPLGSRRLYQADTKAKMQDTRKMGIY